MSDPTLLSSVKLVERLQKLRAETRREPHEVLSYGEVLLSRKSLDSGDDEGELAMHTELSQRLKVAERLMFGRQCGQCASRWPSPRSSWARSSSQRYVGPSHISSVFLARAHWLTFVLSRPAQECADLLSKRFPGSQRVAILVGQIMEARGLTDQARQYYEGILREDESDIVSLHCSTRLTRLAMRLADAPCPLRRPPASG